LGKSLSGIRKFLVTALGERVFPKRMCSPDKKYLRKQIFHCKKSNVILKYLKTLSKRRRLMRNHQNSTDKMTRSIIFFLIMLIILFAGKHTVMAENTIKIGTLLALTGDLAAYGGPIQNGARIAVEHINNAGGVLGKKLELANRDSQTNPTAAVDAAQKLVNIDRVPAIIGALSSGVTIPTATAVSVSNRVVQISPASTSPEITNLKDNDYLFRTVPSDSLQCLVLAKLAQERGFKKISTIYVNNAYGEGLAKAMERAYKKIGGKVLVSVPFNKGEPSYRSEVQKAVKEGPDALLVIAYPENGVKILRQSIEFGLANKFLLPDGMKAPEIIKNVGAKHLNGTYGTSPAPLVSNLTKKFKEEYKKRYGEYPPKPYIDTTFDATVLIALAMQKAGRPDGESIRNAIRDVANPPGEKVSFINLRKALDLLKQGKDIDYEGVSGSADFDKNGDVSSGSYGIWKIEDGKIVDVKVVLSDAL
jgi:ABC-type branched-subunit amino acid transport system substrate-binding protein